MPALEKFDVIVRFGEGIPASVQGEVMLDLEKSLRGRGLPALVFKDTLGDDSKLRRAMTSEQRNRL
jgi:hypothetical protein